jgi:hypothetical protein
MTRNHSNTRNTSSRLNLSESTATRDLSNKLMFGKTPMANLMTLTQETTFDEGKNPNGERLRTSMPDEEL